LTEFVADAMLGTLAKKLRILGFDCKYFASIKDEEILALAKSDSRTIITKDKLLAQKCKKQNLKIIYLESPSEKEQLIKISKECNLTYTIDMSNARCTLCNGCLKKIDSSIITLEMPQITHVSQFWQCLECKHVYWEGSHIRNLKKFISKVNAEIQNKR
jgi:uncharacterized protein with PIN domain